ncbi:MAG: DNA primase [Bacilli bacterium]|nr:DNA primase [Bacilli bacterium]MBN2877933.1 DNA primase [Bacilli bacterium]
MARISQQTIDLIKDTADIVDVVGEFVPLQAAGKNMKGLCPFHSEKTPSFFVSKERQIFNCFGCGKKGDSIKFIQEYKNLSYVDSIHYLAEKYNIVIEEDEHYERQRTDVNLYKANDMALQFYTLNLLNIESGKPALDYLLNRGLDFQTIEEFQLGYAPNKFNALLTHLSNEFQPLDLMNAGLVNRNSEGNFYDLFRDRILFPIRDEQNRVIGFSGRIFGDTDNPAKYVNTPYTEIFSKGMTLYNLYHATPYIRSKERIVLMEGYMDVIKAHMAGVKEAICSMGTQLTIDQAMIIKKYTDNVVVCYDGDKPGREASYKAIKLLERAKLNVHVVSLPDGLDPDEYITTHKDFETFLNNNQLDQYEFVYQMIVEQKDFRRPVEIEQAKDRLFDFFSKTSGMIREIYLKRFASETGIRYDTLIGDYQQNRIDERILNDYQSKLVRTQQHTLKLPKYETAEKTVLNYYLQDIRYRDLIISRFKLLHFQNKDILTILVMMNAWGVYPDEPLVVLKSKLSQKNNEFLEQVLFQDYEYNQEDLESCIKTLEVANLNEDIKANEAEAKKALAAGDTGTYVRLQDENRIIQGKIKKLEGRHNGQKTNY